MAALGVHCSSLRHQWLGVWMLEWGARRGVAFFAHSEVGLPCAPRPGWLRQKAGCRHHQCPEPTCWKYSKNSITFPSIEESQHVPKQRVTLTMFNGQAPLSLLAGLQLRRLQGRVPLGCKGSPGTPPFPCGDKPQAAVGNAHPSPQAWQLHPLPYKGSPAGQHLSGARPGWGEAAAASQGSAIHLPPPPHYLALPSPYSVRQLKEAFPGFQYNKAFKPMRITHLHKTHINNLEEERW